MANPVTE